MDSKILSDFKKDDNFDLFRSRFNLEPNKMHYKEYSGNPYLTLKQKRYKRKTNIPSIKKLKIVFKELLSFLSLYCLILEQGCNLILASNNTEKSFISWTFNATSLPLNIEK